VTTPALIPGAGLRGLLAGPVAAIVPDDGTSSVFFRVANRGGPWASGKILWLVEHDQPPLLARGGRLDGPGDMRFRSGVQGGRELVLDQDTTSTVGPAWRDQPSTERVRADGCYAVQIDGPDFQSVIVFNAQVFGASAPRRTRSVDLRDVKLADGESVVVELHPSDLPIEIDSSAKNVEVCPSGWPRFSGFPACLPVDADGHLTLPSTKTDGFHLGIVVQGIDKQAVDISSVTITYELIDGFFMVTTPPIEPKAKGPSVVVTPVGRTSVGVGPYKGGTVSFDPRAHLVVHQGGKRIGRGGLATGRDEPTFGPLKLDHPIEIHVKNTGSTSIVLGLAVDWN
jgi:hypothetical protein